MIPQSFIEDLLGRVDIAELVGHHVQLKKAGANLAGLCPFHAEKSPSFTVSPSKQFYHCFGCGAHGNAIRFLTEFSGMHFIDAVKELAEGAGLTVPEDSLTPVEREQAASERTRRQTLSEVLARAAAGYRQRLRESQRAIAYLKERGVSGEMALRFGLGYAPDGWNGLASVFAEYDDPLLIESGLVIARGAEVGPVAGGAAEAREAGELERAGEAAGEAPAAGPVRRYDRFRDRVMFPILSVQGDVIGFGGRVLDRGEPKYLNSPETPVFVKGRELYGLFEGRLAIRERGHALVVEGYMDVVALAQAGIGNAVATLGTACTPEHLQKLFRFTDSVVFSFDGDAAGRRAARRALEASLPHASDTRTVRFLFLPSEHDPDSFVRELGAAAFERRIAEAVPLSRQLIEAAGEGCDLDTAEGRAHLLANARPLWNTLPDGTLKRQLLTDLAAAARDDAAQLRRQWNVAGAAFPYRAAQNAGSPRLGGLRPSRSAATLLDRAIWLLLQRSELWSRLDGDTQELLSAQPPPHGDLFGGIERSLHEHGALAAAALLDDLRAQRGDASTRMVLDRIAGFHAPEANGDPATELEHVVRKLRLNAVDDELRSLFESGVASPDAQRRSRDLLEARRRLKL